MVKYAKFACNDYNYSVIMNQELDDYLTANNVDFYSLEPYELEAIAEIISGLTDGSYTFSITEALTCLNNNFFYVRYLAGKQLLDSSLYLENPELCDCYVRYYVTLEIVNERFEEHSR